MDAGDESICGIVTPDAIATAAARIADVLHPTPLMPVPVLAERLGRPVYVKPECLQRTGSFKIRGAMNRLAQLSADERKAGVVAFSSGNHAQGVAEAARLLGIAATIVMPADAPAIKIARTRRAGAEVVLYDRDAESREEKAAALAAERGAVLVPSYDDPMIIAGQGTVGFEIAEEARARDILPGTVLFPIGGGGLAGGSAVALKARFPDVALYGVEPVGHDDAARSLRLGRREARSDPAHPTLCDGLLAPRPGRLTFPLLHRYLEEGLVVNDEEVRTAMRFALTELKLVVEPSGAVTLAALLAGRPRTLRGAVILVLSGGNVDAQPFARLIASA